MFAIDLVKNHEDIRNELKYFYNEIMVDEYQDTSDLQELFISEIANDNVYTVGDIKQAIYGFRNANPELFKRKYDLYAKSINGEKIDLTNNFRSREQVIDFINLLFSSIMDNDIGGANYRLDHLMLFGNHSYDSSSTSSFDSDILCYSDILEEYKTEFRREEIEAFLIAKDIDNKVKNRFQVLDKESTRDCRYEDFAILIDKGSDFDLFKQIFDYMHVPLFIDKDKRLTNSYDVSTIANIIRLVVKCKESNNVDIESKYLFTSIARSFLYSMSDNEILIHFKNNDFIDTDIFSKCKYISTYLDSTSPNKIFDLIINTFSFYEKIELVGNVEEFMIRIEELSNMCSSLTEIGHDIYYISKYFLDILEEEKDVRYKSSSDDGKSVKIMTIHNSKGLEFKICYFAGLYHQFNIKELTNRFIFDNELGFITPYYKDGINDTFIHMLLQNKEIKNIISEKIRLFYVALTRAKEKIILVTGNNFESIKDFDNIVPSLTRMNYKSFDHILVSTYNKISKFITNVDINKFYISDKYRYTATKDAQSFTINDSSLKVEELNIISNTTSKTHYSKGIKRLLSYEEYENIEVGNKIHEILENLDFYNPNYDLVESKFVDIIKSFLNSSLLKNVENAKVYKEYKFIKNDSIGIIDLILEYEDYINIIDYKLSNIDDESYEKQLKEYKIFISSITNKEVNTYLYSLNKKIYKEIK